MDTNENQQGIVRCVGKPDEEVKVYLEEKSDLFLKENMTNRVGHFQLYYLLGREYRLGRQTIYLIRGILEGESGSSRQIHFTADQLRSLQRRQERQYPKYKVLGWALNQPGYGNDGAWRFARDNEDFFRESPLLMLGDGLDGSLVFYRWQNGDYRELGGYYVYTDQNPADFSGMHMAEQRETARKEAAIASVIAKEKPTAADGPLPWELPLEEEQKQPARPYFALKDKKRPRRTEGASMRMLTSLSAVLLTVTLVMGMLLFNSVSTLDGIQNRLEAMDMQIEEMHETIVTAPASAPAAQGAADDAQGAADAQPDETGGQ